MNESLSELKKVHIEVKEEAARLPQPTGSEEDEEEEEEEDDEEEDDDEEESEGAQEEEKAVKGVPACQGKRKAARVSEDESSESDDDDGRSKEERLYDRAKRRIEVSECKHQRSESLLVCTRL